MSKIITCEEVIKHNNKDSVWLVIRRDVYDVTKYLEEHPGGEQILLEVAGQEATQPFDDVGHSDDAKEILRKFKIGSLPAGEKMPSHLSKPEPSNVKSQCSLCSSKRCYSTRGPNPPPSSNRRWVLPLLALASAVLIGIALKKYYISPQ